MRSRTRIGGVLDLRALSALSDAPATDAGRKHFRALSHDDQVAAIRGLAAEAQSEQSIAQATGLSIETIRAILGRQEAPP